MNYPWQAKQWQQVWQAKETGRLAHGLLLAGLAGTGKLHFAKHFTQALLCQHVSPLGEPCHTCHACRLVLTDVHPNVFQVSPEEEGHAIKVDQIRALAEFVQQSSLQGGYRVAIIHPAHNMNISAANALLKTLEEPAEGAILILVTDQSGHLPATILSRCQRILFPRPEHHEALAWLSAQPHANAPEQALRLAHGAPLLALSASQQALMPLRTEVFQALEQLAAKRTDPLTLAAKWQKTDSVQWLDLLLGFIADLMKLQLGSQAIHLTNQDQLGALQNCTTLIPLERNAEIMRLALKMRGQISAGINFNKQLLIESLLIRWARTAA